MYFLKENKYSVVTMQNRMAGAVVRIGGNLHIARTECTETAVQKHRTMGAVLTGKQEWARETGL